MSQLATHFSNFFPKIVNKLAKKYELGIWKTEPGVKNATEPRFLLLLTPGTKFLGPRKRSIGYLLFSSVADP